jgi:hypothetical protein
MKNILRTVVTSSVAGILIATGAMARADQNVGVQYKMPIHVKTHVDETGCKNNPGPKITLSGEIALGGLGVQLTFQNNEKGTHQTVVTFATNIVLIPLGTKVTIPKQPVQGGVGGNPHIWLQFCDENGTNHTAISEEIYLGRCVQGLDLDNDLLNETIAALLISASGCENHPGPKIYFGGGANLSGLCAKLILRNNLKGTHTAEWETTITLIPDGAPLTIPKQPSQGGSGGNPLIWIQFLQGNGDPIGDPQFLGRCNQI